MEHWIKTDYNENQEPYSTLNQNRLWWESRTIFNTESKQTIMRIKNHMEHWIKTDYNENQEPYGTLNQNRL